MPTDWGHIDSWKRLAAATWAASPQPHNYRNIATFFGQDATYDSIEGRFRIIKKEAANLKNEVETGQRPEAPMRGAVTAGGSPRKKRGNKSEGTPRRGAANESSQSTPTKTPRSSQAVMTGRVSKNANNTANFAANGSPSKSSTKRAGKDDSSRSTAASSVASMSFPPMTALPGSMTCSENDGDDSYWPTYPTGGSSGEAGLGSQDTENDDLVLSQDIFSPGTDKSRGTYTGGHGDNHGPLHGFGSVYDTEYEDILAAD